MFMVEPEHEQFWISERDSKKQQFIERLKKLNVSTNLNCFFWCLREVMIEQKWIRSIRERSVEHWTMFKFKCFVQMEYLLKKIVWNSDNICFSESASNSASSGIFFINNYLLGCSGVPVRSCIVVRERNERKKAASRTKSHSGSRLHVTVWERYFFLKLCCFIRLVILCFSQLSELILKAVILSFNLTSSSKC